MAENNFFKLLEESFPKTNREVWKKTAVKELNGNEPFTELQWKDQDKLEFSPYYDKEDLIKLQFHHNFNLKPSTDPFLGSRSWLNMPNITVANEVTANKIALAHLQNGADGVLLDVSENPAINFDVLLQDIQLEYCAIAFKGANESFADRLSAYISKLPVDKSKIQIVIFWDDVPQTRQTDRFQSFPNLLTLGFNVRESSPINEIHDALVFGVTLLDTASNVESVFNRIAFSMNCDPAFLNQIAKLKALRRLWFQVASIYDVKNYDPSSLHIHVRSNAWIEKNFQPHGNMLKSTTAAMSAIIGGCNSLTIFAETDSNPTMNRIARNVSSILREESYFDKVSDPLAGSFAIEAMTDQVAKGAWDMFQNTMNKK